MNASDPSARLRRAHKRSYTPLVTREHRPVNAPLGCELPAIMFIESLGVRVHYATGADLGTEVRGPSLLARSRAYVSVGHDEYWSYRQRANVEDARDSANGLHLSFWSGNEAYWAVRFEPSALPQAAAAVSNLNEPRQQQQGATPEQLAELSDEPPRTMVCYKETQSLTKLDPLEGSWTGTFRDGRPINPRGAMPENALTGTMFAANAQRQDLLVIDAARFGRHRMWRHTTVADVAARAAAKRRNNRRSNATDAECAAAEEEEGTCYRSIDDDDDEDEEEDDDDYVVVLGPRGVLGHEWDEDVDNGCRPAHLQRLSETTVDNVQAIMDYGSTFDTGSATHSLVLRREPAPSKAFVFGAGTVQWSWALGSLHDVNDPPRANKYATRLEDHKEGPTRELQQLTVNVLAEMGVAMPLLGVPTTTPQRQGRGRGRGGRASLVQPAPPTTPRRRPPQSSPLHASSAPAAAAAGAAAPGTNLREKRMR